MHVHGAVLWYISLHAFLPMMVEQIWDMSCLAPYLLQRPNLNKVLYSPVLSGRVHRRGSHCTVAIVRENEHCFEIQNNVFGDSEHVTRSWAPWERGWLGKQAARYLTFVVMRRCSHWWRKAPDSSVHCTCFVYDVCMCCVVSKLKITSYKVPPGVNRHRRDYVCVCVPRLDTTRIFWMLIGQWCLLLCPSKSSHNHVDVETWNLIWSYVLSLRMEIYECWSIHGAQQISTGGNLQSRLRRFVHCERLRIVSSLVLLYDGLH